jgi:hypothetical protein
VRVGTTVRCICPASNEIKDSITVRDNTNEQQIEGISINPSPNVTGLVDFSNEATSSVVVNKDVSSLHISPIVDEYQDIKRYFERPRLVTSGSLAVIRGSLYAISVPIPLPSFGRFKHQAG